MKNSLLTAGALALGTLLGACGGGSGDSAPASAQQGTETAKQAGPLDAVQDPVSSQITGPLADAVAGTPLEAVVICVDRIVVTDTLDVVDGIAVALQAGGSGSLSSLSARSNLQNQLLNTVVDLQGLLTTLAGDAQGCILNAAPAGGNPLAGTPLAAVGEALAPVLAQVYGSLPAPGSTPLPLSTLVSLYSQLNSALQTAFAQLPQEVSGAPILGDALSSVQNAVTQTGLIVSTLPLANPALTQAVLASSLNSILHSVLLGVVPVTEIESQAGQTGTLSGPISDGIDALTAQLAGGSLASLNPQTLLSALSGAGLPLFGPIEQNLIGGLAAPLFEALDGVGMPGSNPLGPLSSALSGFFGGSPTPLSFITDLLGGSTCPTQGTLLEILCGF